jgi:RNase adaptor protein for sRNA GlmZ degradation
MSDMNSNFDLGKVPFDQYAKIISDLRESGRETDAENVENAILNFTASMQKIVRRVRKASRKKDINERNAIVEQIQKELHQMKF